VAAIKRNYTTCNAGPPAAWPLAEHYIRRRLKVSCVLYTCALVLTLTRHIKVYLRIIYEILWHVSIHTQLPTVSMLLPCTVSKILALLKHVTANDVQKSFISGMLTKMIMPYVLIIMS